MVQQFWPHGKKEIVIIAVTVIIAGVSICGIRSCLLVQVPNGPTVFWQLEPSRR
jgi:hypothetical protein